MAGASDAEIRQERRIELGTSGAFLQLVRQPGRSLAPPGFIHVSNGQPLAVGSVGETVDTR